MQALHLLGLDPIAESQADGHSYGFRLERRCADALEQTHLLLPGQVDHLGCGLPGGDVGLFGKGVRRLVAHRSILRRCVESGGKDQNR